MPSTELFAADAAYWCDSGNLGYGQDTRDHFWQGGAVDCSSLVRYCLEGRGFATGADEAGLFYTGNMRGLLCARGWTAYSPWDIDPDVGDILLAEGEHVEVYVGGYGQRGPLAGAMINEVGDIVGGADGDQTGEETSTHGYYNYPWTHILRYEGYTNNTTETSSQEDDMTNEQAKQLAEVHWAVNHILTGPETNSDIFVAEQRRWRDQVNEKLEAMAKAIDALAIA